MKTNTKDSLKKLLSENIVSFTFEKKDGSIREAIGTTSPKVIQKHVLVDDNKTEKKKKKKTNDDLIIYFDLDLEAFRCFHIDRFIKINDLEFID